MTGCKNYVRFTSPEEAQKGAETLQFYVTAAESTVKSITAEGSYVVYDFNEDGYLFTDYAAAKEAFDAYKELAGQIGE